MAETGDKITSEGVDDDSNSKTDKSKKGTKTVKRRTNKTEKTPVREFDWPKKNYFEVTCVAAENAGSGQRMVKPALTVAKTKWL